MWAIYGPIAASITLANLLLYDFVRLPYFVLSFGVTVIVAVLLFYTGGFGGADSKALICIALALPFSTEAVFMPILPNGVSPLSQVLFPITIFSNSVLLAATTGVYLLLYNVIWHKRLGRKMFEGALHNEPLGKKLLTTITGYKTTINKLKEKWHIYPMEDVEEVADSQLMRRLVLLPRDEGRDEIVERLSKAIDSGRIGAHVWATPGLPMLIFITAGVIVSIVFGDIVWIIISSILG